MLRDETNCAVSLSGGDHAICPVCRVRSHSRHSSYRRTLRDLPAQGTPVEVRAQMTRWRCRNDRCERRIFAERIPGLAAPFARRTTRLAGTSRCTRRRRRNHSRRTGTRGIWRRTICPSPMPRRKLREKTSAPCAARGEALGEDLGAIVSVFEFELLDGS